MSLLKQLKSPLLIGAAFSAMVSASLTMAAEGATQEPVTRIVSADGALTEIVYALDAQDRLVGVDTTSGYPVQARKKPQIGYKRALSAEGVLSLEPQVLIATQDSGPPPVIAQIRGAGVDVQVFSSKPTLAAIEEKITGVAKVLNKEQEGDALWQNVKAAIEQAQARNIKADKPVKVMFILNMTDRGPIVAGMGTEADSIVQLAGGQNAVQSMHGYKPVTSEVIIGLQPDVVLMMGRGDHAMDADTLFAKPGFSSTPAAKTKRLVTMDGMLMLGFGPRTGQAIEALNKAFYPQGN